MRPMSDLQEFIDRYYWKHGPCCAGCDWWRYMNSMVGECRKSPPVKGKERWGILGIEKLSAQGLSPGHMVTRRDHHCGEFKDEFDWGSLSLAYRKRVGASLSLPLPEGKE